MNQQEEYLLAKKYGFKCALDPQRGGNWSKFSKGNYHIWAVMASGKQCWQTAYNVNNYFKGHGIVSTLEDAFQRGANMTVIKFDNLGGEDTHARYHAELKGWDFTVEYHHVAKKWYCEAIFGGQNQWKHWFQGKDEHYCSSLNEAFAKVLDFASYNLRAGGTYSLDILGDSRSPTETPLKESKKLEEETGCGCGSKYTQNPSHHLRYCPLFKKD